MSSETKTRVLICISPSAAPLDSAEYFDPTSSVSGLSSLHNESGVEVKVLSHPSFEEFDQVVGEFKPTVIYLGAPANFDLNKETGTLEPFCFKDGTTADSIIGTFFSGKGVETLYVDAHADYDQVQAVQSRGEVPNAIAWSVSPPPAIIAAQFAHTFFSVLVTYAAAPNEAFTLASHVVQSHCTTLVDGSYVAPPLPSLLSSLKAELPDNNSIPPLVYPGVEPNQSLATAIPGWSDIRLLAPRAELRLLLTGGSSLVNSHRLSFLGEALRALLVIETRSLTLVSTWDCAKVPVNLAQGCAALRCEVRTASGRTAFAIVGGQPDVLKNLKLVEHALRMTLVSDSQSLQFRLPPPGVAIPAPRTSAAIAGNTPVVDTLVLTSVWAVQVLRALCQDVKSFGLLSMGVAAVGASATAGLTATDVQRLKMVVSGMGPSAHPAEPLPEAASLETAATEEVTKEEGAEEAAKVEEAEEEEAAAAGEGMEGVEATVADGMEE